MVSVSSQRGSKSSGETGSPGPARRPIPLPPDSLRPPPRKVRSQSAATTQSVSAGRARKSGASRGFWLGLSVPVLGFLVAGLYLGRGGLLPGAEAPAAGTGPEMQVRARIDQAETGTPEVRIPPAAATETAAAEPADPGTESLSPTGSGPVSGVVEEETLPAAGGEVLAIQLASFRTERKARAVLQGVQDRTGLPGVVLPATVAGVRWQRILLGAFSSLSEARSAARPLLDDGTIGELVIRPVPREWVPALTGKDLK